MTYRQMLEKGKILLKDSKAEEYDNDAFELLSFVTGISRTDFLLKSNEELPEEYEKKYNELIRKRSTRYPLQYITGEAWFYGRKFYVDENVLIPRFDTENLVEWIIKEEKNSKRFLDMCTGSGCIAVTIKEELKGAEAFASDLSGEALKVASKNADIIGSHIDFIQSDLYENITGRYDFIVSNPPYIESKVIDTLMPEVKEYEPYMALDGGEDGLFFYREIIKNAPKFLNPGGRLYFEIGYDQAESVGKLLDESGFKDIEVRKDLAGNDRCIRGILGE